MFKSFRFLAVLFVVSIFSVSAQSNLVVHFGGNTYKIPSYERQGALYFSIKDFADLLGVKNEFDAETENLLITFPAYTLKVTAKNPYLVIIPKQASQGAAEPQVYQLPTSSYSVNGNIYIPVEYSLPALEKASGLSMDVEEPNVLIVKGKLEAAERDITPGPAQSSEAEKKNYNLNSVTLEEKANGTLIRVRSNKKIKSYNSSFAEGILTVILRNVLADPEKIDKVFKKGLVRQIRSKNRDGDTELQFVLTKEYTTSEVIDVPGTNDILITIHNKIFSRNESNDKNKEKWNFDVIVIDAGHGGKDYGAIGVNGVKEKDVNLGIALKLGSLIEKNMKDVKVVYTRKNDTFVELYKRGKIANERGGKLFISIHCNSTPQKPTDASGFEVYLLRPGRTKEAISIASRENSVIQYEENPGRYQALTDENFILVSMAHSSYMKYSEQFADIINHQFSNDLSLSSRGVKQAGFYVLVGASMPGILIESGFLSNKKDADYLKSSKGEQNIAASIFQSVKKFKEYYNQFIKE